MYKPKPINTMGIELPEDILKLVEKLAENAHDVWALQRKKDGWTKGPSRDDKLLQHPCLVPYEELEEAEKEYDRKMALETLKTILALGFGIENKIKD
jgi:hypothetical protein